MGNNNFFGNQGFPQQQQQQQQQQQGLRTGMGGQVRQTKSPMNAKKLADQQRNDNFTSLK
eukprot:Awhi_evm1s4049